MLGYLILVYWKAHTMMAQRKNSTNKRGFKKKMGLDEDTSHMTHRRSQSLLSI